jgi:hypothetical protein
MIKVLCPHCGGFLRTESEMAISDRFFRFFKLGNICAEISKVGESVVFQIKLEATWGQNNADTYYEFGSTLEEALDNLEKVVMLEANRREAEAIKHATFCKVISKELEEK